MVSDTATVAAVTIPVLTANCQNSSSTQTCRKFRNVNSANNFGGVENASTGFRKEIRNIQKNGNIAIRIQTDMLPVNTARVAGESGRFIGVPHAPGRCGPGPESAGW